MRGAAVGAAGYAVGKRAARRNAEDPAAEGEEAYDEQEGEEAPQAEAGALTSEQIDSLKQLAELKEQGILTQEEFDAQKEKLLQGG
jgi:hypothetical protein